MLKIRISAVESRFQSPDCQCILFAALDLHVPATMFSARLACNCIRVYYYEFAFLFYNNKLLILYDSFKIWLNITYNMLSCFKSSNEPFWMHFIWLLSICKLFRLTSGAKSFFVIDFRRLKLKSSLFKLFKFLKISSGK